MSVTASTNWEYSFSGTTADNILALVEAMPGIDSEQIAERMGLTPYEACVIVCELRREGLLVPA